MFLSFCVLDDIFRFSKKSGLGVFFVQQNMVETTLSDGLETSGFLGILGPPSYGIGATIRIGQEMLCLPYAGFFLMNLDKKL